MLKKNNMNQIANRFGIALIAVMLTLCTKQTVLAKDNAIQEAGNAKMNCSEENVFYYEEITPQFFETMKGKSYKADCKVPLTDLCLLHVAYVDFENEKQTGEIVCNKKIAKDLLEIFQELYEAFYQIEKITPIDAYDADDERSMADNNSSCFNYRTISFSNVISKHGLGVAIDINPLYNPYVKKVNGRLNIEPANGAPYVDRSLDFPHKIDHNDLCYQLFKAHGFTWGGDWSRSKDYQHFEKNIDAK